MSESDVTRNIAHDIIIALRHRPWQYGLDVDIHGWATTISVIFAFDISRAYLRKIVENEYPRLELSSDGARVRARYGHTIHFVADAGKRMAPPSVLFHGTSEKSLTAIYRSGGIASMRRNYVHLHDTHARALEIGARHGDPRVLVVAAEKMHAEGYTFVCASYGVWLTLSVPVRFLSERYLCAR